MHRSICYTPFTYYVELVPAFRPHSGTLVRPKVYLSLNVVGSWLFHSSPSYNVTGFNMMPCPSISPSPTCAPTVHTSLSLRFLLQVSYQHSRCFQPSNTVRPLSYGWARNSLCKNPRIVSLSWINMPPHPWPIPSSRLSVSCHTVGRSLASRDTTCPTRAYKNIRLTFLGFSHCYSAFMCRMYIVLCC